MRRVLMLACAAAASFATLLPRVASGQTPARPDPQSTATPATSAAPTAPADGNLPPNTHFTFGDRVVPAGTRVEGAAAVANGNLDVYGTVNGNAIALNGSVRVHHGGEVTGSAYAAGGPVVIDGGIVRGGQRSFTRAAAPARPASPPLTTFQSVKLVLWSFAILLIIGLGVMIFAEPNLDGVSAALEHGFARSFWLGIAGELLILPALAILCVALALTVIGVLLVPFAIVAYTIALAGLLTLGFLAAARLTGSGFVPRRGAAAERGVHMRAMVAGLVLYAILWVLAAAFRSSPIAGAVLRGVSLVVTWVALTIGLGATLASRAGTERRRATSRTGAEDLLSWQTPTPVTGVAAARRPVTAGSAGPA
jgi:hypothetical protein